VLNDWHAMLDRDTAQGRRSLRDVLLSPIFVKQEADGTWSYRLIGSFSGVIKQVWGVQVSDADIAEMNAAVDAEMARVGAAAPGDQDDRRVQRDTCPRGDSNTRHAV
jgi:hypothetical protein